MRNRARAVTRAIGTVLMCLATAAAAQQRAAPPTGAQQRAPQSPAQTATQGEGGAVVLNDPDPPQFIGVEEPENFLHPRLLQGLAEECRASAARSQLLVTTHSPYFLNGLGPQEVRVLYRDEQGHSQAVRLSDDTRVRAFMANGALLGDLWMEQYFGVGDPLVNAGAPRRRSSVSG